MNRKIETLDSKKMDFPKFNFKFKKNYQGLEYNEEEIHSFLLVLLELRNLKPYVSALVPYEQTTSQKQFTPSNSLRNVNPAIFAYNKTIFVCLYPTLLPKVINGKKFFDFDEQLGVINKLLSR